MRAAPLAAAALLAACTPGVHRVEPDPALARCPTPPAGTFRALTGDVDGDAAPDTVYVRPHGVVSELGVCTASGRVATLTTPRGEVAGLLDTDGDGAVEVVEHYDTQTYRIVRYDAGRLVRLDLALTARGLRDHLAWGCTGEGRDRVLLTARVDRHLGSATVATHRVDGDRVRTTSRTLRVPEDTDPATLVPPCPLLAGELTAGGPGE